MLGILLARHASRSATTHGPIAARRGDTSRGEACRPVEVIRVARVRDDGASPSPVRHQGDVGKSPAVRQCGSAARAAECGLSRYPFLGEGVISEVT